MTYESTGSDGSATSSSNGPCVEVGTGSVGEPGITAQVEHQVEAKIEKLMVLRSVESSLCPDHGVVAVLTVNGELAASGVITEVGSSIQAGAKPGDWVVATVSTFPLNNGVVCVRFGELDFRLDECDLV